MANPGAFSRDTHELIEIAAPPDRVWEVLTDTARFPEWNPVTPGFDGELRVGAKAKLRFREGPGKPTLTVPVEVQRVEPGVELRWVGGMPGTGWLVNGSHYFRFQPGASKDRTVLKHGETFSGLLVPAIWPILGPKIAAAYKQLNAAIKARAEGSA